MLNFCLLKCIFEKVDFLRYAQNVSFTPIFHAARRTVSGPDGAWMTLMPDDDPELAMSPAVIPPDVDFLPALIGGEGPVSPARAYLLSLNSPAAGRPWPRSSALLPVCSALRPSTPAAGAACAVIT